MWASVSELADSVPSTQSHKREAGTIMLWLHAQGVTTVVFDHCEVSESHPQSLKWEMGVTKSEPQVKVWWKVCEEDEESCDWWDKRKGPVNKQWAIIDWLKLLTFFFMWEPWTMKQWRAPRRLLDKKGSFKYKRWCMTLPFRKEHGTLGYVINKLLLFKYFDIYDMLKWYGISFLFCYKEKAVKDAAWSNTCRNPQKGNKQEFSKMNGK